MNIIEVDSFTEVPENYTGIVVWRNVAKFWYKEGKYHRVDRPAIEWADGSKEWWVDGKRHRIDGPAVENVNRKKEWYIEGKRHRIDGPAVEYKDGSKEWHLEGSFYHSMILEIFFKDSIFLGKEKGKYDLNWIRFLTEGGIQEFPIIPGMEEDKEFKVLFEKLRA